MKRLTEEPSLADPAAVNLAELVQNAPRLRDNPFRKQKLLLRLRRAAPATQLGFRAPALAAIVVAALGTAGIAAASYGWFGHRAPEVEAGSARAARLPASASPQPLPQRSTVAERPPSPPPEAFGNELPLPLPASSPLLAKPIASAQPRRPERAVTNRARIQDDAEDPSKVLEAIRALRKQGNAARAQLLLDQYLKMHPTGALSEDALVLSIEAALARHNPRAADYARRYLTSYPSGRFRSLAERVLASRR